VPGSGEVGAVADFEQDPGGGPDPNAGHRDQDPGKRVGIENLLHLGGQLAAAAQDVTQRVGQAGQHGLCRGGAGYYHCLFVERGHDGIDQVGAGTGRIGQCRGGELAASGLAESGRAAVAGEQFQRCLGV
jgi:hypothetical protein